MNYLGISGIPGLQDRFNENNKITDYRDSRIVQGLDSAAALIVNKEIIFASAQERFSGNKGTGEFPMHAIYSALNYGNINIDDITKLGWSFNYSNTPASLLGHYASFYQVDNIRRHLHRLIPGSEKIEIVPIQHHYAHALSATAVSGFERSLVVVADGMGELTSISLYQYQNHELTKIYAYPISKSIGIFYSIITRFLGFCFNQDEYKVMGMAAYGSETYLDKFKKLISFKDGNLTTNLKFNTLEDPLYHHLFNELEEFFAIKRPTSSEQLNSNHYSLAASLQSAVTSVMLELVRYWVKKTNNLYLCGAGGVFLNCLMNQRIAEEIKPTGFFIQPAAGDDGAALGAALAVAGKENRPVSDKKFIPYLGKSWNRAEIENTLQNTSLNFKWLGQTDAIERAATVLNEGHVIAWFNGKSEYGPRALGNRSILANPGWPNIKNLINQKIKFRELFRPFAPAVLEEDATKYFYFEKTELCYYMLQIATVIPHKAVEISGIVHADGTARIQLVTASINAVFHQLISTFKSKSNLPCLLNTSFNTSGQPLINDPQTAIETFNRTELDYLFIEGFVVWK
ncbi:MAG: nodulation protein and probable carbamoyl transferase [uncultured bacterium]|nr:MAG: nodulation protein and probable carbamoyl transferase [uncultured bacterium]OGT15259.1 MAG: hypothetical protein A3B69_02560 [Gammaproteobacteria bacterium RIFCSPHIGHO2_02_FULL_38_33]OGT23924.1 MAG: hypothetical protein A2W47_01710 [Gammaproteobacteria bacterium RIFCSPHIGHO2_12_38_15]OGT67746.1 MAG: hypothetical protein A3I12_03665 [Gammaproteobacteria bacterium RIFCSPLOWO2_02_FULL_38_11]